MSLFRGIDDSDAGRKAEQTPVGAQEEIRRVADSRPVAVGTLACRECDAPVALAGAVSPADPLTCPFCLHTGAVREFLSLGEPTRPARVVVRVSPRSRIQVARTR